MLVFMIAMSAFLAGSQPVNLGTPVSDAKIVLTDPKPIRDRKLVVLSGAEFVVTIRISHLDKTLRPDATFARFMRGKAQAGEFLARPRTVNDNEVEYSTKVKAPTKPGVYKLIVAPSPFSQDVVGSLAKDKYPSLDVTVE